MKKFTLIFATVLMALCLVFTGCNNVAENNNDNNDNGANTSSDADLLAYNASLEAALEKYQPKEDIDKEILATVGGIPVSGADVKYTASVIKAMADETTTEEQILEETELFYKENAALINAAFERGITLSEDDLLSIETNVSSIKQSLGDEFDSYFVDAPFTKNFYFRQTALYQTIYSKIYDEILADKDSDITKSALEEAKSEIVRAKHILIQFPSGEGENGELTDAQKADTLAKANAVLEEVNAMSDISEFDALIEKYNEDPGMQSNPDGYYFGRGEMVPEFEESAYSLEEGKTSGLVETTYGYHILLKLPAEDEEAICNSNAFLSLFNEKVYSTISEKADSYVVEYAENHDARVEEFVAEYKEILASENAAN